MPDTASKTDAGRHFEDFRLGETLVHGTPRTLTEGDMALYIALTGSRFPLQSAAPVAHSMGLEGRPADELLVFHVGFGKTVNDISLNAVANLGYASVLFPAVVYPGDTLRAESTVIGLRQNRNGSSGIVYVRSVTFNQHGRPVMSWVRWVMVKKRDPAAPAPDTVVPELPDHVPVAQLTVPPRFSGRGYDTSVTGSPHLWEDYQAGERIHHVNGMTVDDSDHTLATRLYQNNARLHFEASMMKGSPFGRRLMYGGHVISVCRALTFNGLANAVRIAAINGGTHCHPAFAGDTFYAFTDVLAAWPLSGRTDLGALRLRTVGIRDTDTRELDDPMEERDGRRVYRDEVVLDLDYTVLMPRRGG